MLDINFYIQKAVDALMEGKSYDDIRAICNNDESLYAVVYREAQWLIHISKITEGDTIFVEA